MGLSQMFKLYPLYLYLIVIAFLVVEISSENDGKLQGKIWQISDIHLDKLYSQTGNKNDMCHVTAAPKVDVANGYYGDINCDSPLTLVKSAVSAMHKYEPDPDFIFWTGDNAPHVKNPEPNWDEIYEILKNVSRLLSKTFPNATILPVIGNHDLSPPNSITAKQTDVYKAYLKRGGWEIFPPFDDPAFLTGGFYSQVINNNNTDAKLRILGLNSILWYTFNPAINQSEQNDPGGQFQWLEQQLDQAATNGEKVYILGHVSPGHSSRGKETIPVLSLYHDKYNKKYVELIKKYSHVIYGQFFGHLHLDNFMLITDAKDQVVNSMFLASSVTPWHSLKPMFANLSVPVNPSVRLYTYEKTSAKILDYEQYFLNLSDANTKHEINLQHQNDPHEAPNEKSANNDTEATWQLLYRFTQAYNLSDASTASLGALYKMLLTNQNNVFLTYYNYTTAGYRVGECDDFCRGTHLCAIACVTEAECKLCRGDAPPTKAPTVSPSPVVTPTMMPIVNPPYHTMRNAFIATLIIAIVIMSVVGFIYYRKKNSRPRGPRYSSFGP